MGVDACIFFRSRKPDPFDDDICLPRGTMIRKHDDADLAPMATHEVVNGFRYYGPEYERGPWPEIASIILTLLANRNIETVWYFGDSVDNDEPFTEERFNQYNAHFIRNEHRPYKEFFNRPVK